MAKLYSVKPDQLTMLTGRLAGGLMYPGAEEPSHVPVGEQVAALTRPAGIAFSIPVEGGALLGHALLPQHYLVVDLLAEMTSMARMELLFSGEAQGQPNVVNIDYFMIPTRRVKLAVQLSELAVNRFFLPTYPGSLKGHVRYGRPMESACVNGLTVALGRGRDLRSLEIFEIAIYDTLPDFTVQGKPLVDPLGQWIDADWPGKMNDEAALVGYLKAERTKAASMDYPEGWSRFGGWLQKCFTATGWFHTERDGRRWWLVDPDGYAFISNGCCYGSRCGVHGFVDGMENLFSWLPDDAAYRDAWTTADQIAEFAKRNGRESGRERRMFNFARANMIRAFGDKWWENWADMNGARLRGWGFNTIGVGVNNYADEHVLAYLERVRIPFVWTLKEFPLTETCIFRDFPDVFAPEYATRAARFAAEQLTPLRDNRYLIGYFVTNEPEWLFARDVNPAERLLAHPRRLHSKAALVNFLCERYGRVEALNTAWGTSFASFDDLYTPLEAADRLSDAANRDLTDFRSVLIEMYNRVPAEALKAVDGVHMNLGMRYSDIRENDMAGDDFTSVFSFNCYRQTPLPMLTVASRETDKPLMIGEWHIAGSDAKLFASGLVVAPSQAERARACAHYMETAFAQPNCVGLHYFEFNDQPLLGRFDGECMQHGLIDICNRPYANLTAAMQASARRMYDICDGTLAPTGVDGAYTEPF